MLVPQTDAARPTDGGVRRYSLARLGMPARSALGEDRHERLERVAGMNGVYAARPRRLVPPAPNGAGPAPDDSAPAPHEQHGQAVLPS